MLFKGPPVSHVIRSLHRLVLYILFFSCAFNLCNWCLSAISFRSILCMHFGLHWYESVCRTKRFGFYSMLLQTGFWQLQNIHVASKIIFDVFFFFSSLHAYGSLIMMLWKYVSIKRIRIWVKDAQSVMTQRDAIRCKRIESKSVGLCR